jgi:PEP-CTERM motif
MLGHNRLLWALFWSLVVFFQGSVRGGSVTYNIQNYPAEQDGWTLAGTITITSKTASGTITEDNENIITAWGWTISKGSESYTNKSTDKNAELTITGSLSYTSTQILLPAAKDPGDALYLTGTQIRATLTWRNIPDKTFYAAVYIKDGRAPYAWGSSPEKLGGNPWVLAAVPEPSTLLLMGIGFVSVIPYAVVQRRRTGLRSVNETRPFGHSRPFGSDV